MTHSACDFDPCGERTETRKIKFPVARARTPIHPSSVAMDDTEVDDVNEDLEEVLRGSISSSARLTGEAGTDGLRHRKGGAADDGAAAETKGDDAGAEVRGLKLTASKHGMVNEGILHQLLTQQRESRCRSIPMQGYAIRS